MGSAGGTRSARSPQPPSPVQGSNGARPRAPQINMPAVVFCMSWCNLTLSSGWRRAGPPQRPVGPLGGSSAGRIPRGGSGHRILWCCPRTSRSSFRCWQRRWSAADRRSSGDSRCEPTVPRCSRCCRCSCADTADVLRSKVRRGQRRPSSSPDGGGGGGGGGGGSSGHQPSIHDLRAAKERAGDPNGLPKQRIMSQSMARIGGRSLSGRALTRSVTRSVDEQ